MATRQRDGDRKSNTSTRPGALLLYEKRARGCPNRRTFWDAHPPSLPTLAVLQGKHTPFVLRRPCCTIACQRELERAHLARFFWFESGRRRFLMKYHAACVAAVLAVIAPEEAGANAPGGANWFLRSPDGSSQGPYGLSQLGEWSSSGYVSLGKSSCSL